MNQGGCLFGRLKNSPAEHQKIISTTACPWGYRRNKSRVKAKKLLSPEGSFARKFSIAVSFQGNDFFKELLLIWSTSRTSCLTEDGALTSSLWKTKAFNISFTSGWSSYEFQSNRKLYPASCHTQRSPLVSTKVFCCDQRQSFFFQNAWYSIQTIVANTDQLTSKSIDLEEIADLFDVWKMF